MNASLRTCLHGYQTEPTTFLLPRIPDAPSDMVTRNSWQVIAHHESFNNLSACWTHQSASVSLARLRAARSTCDPGPKWCDTAHGCAWSIGLQPTDPGICAANSCIMDFRTFLGTPMLGRSYRGRWIWDEMRWHEIVWYDIVLYSLTRYDMI